MSYDDEQLDRIRIYLEQCTGRRKPTPGGIKATIKPLTLKAEDGRFVKVEQCDPRTLEEYPTYDGWFRIMEDQP